MSVEGPSITIRTPLSHLRDAALKNPPATPRGNDEAKKPPTALRNSLATPQVISQPPSLEHLVMASSASTVDTTLMMVDSLASSALETGPSKKRATPVPSRSIIDVTNNREGDK